MCKRLGGEAFAAGGAAAKALGLLSAVVGVGSSIGDFAACHGKGDAYTRAFACLGFMFAMVSSGGGAYAALAGGEGVSAGVGSGTAVFGVAGFISDFATGYNDIMCGIVHSVTHWYTGFENALQGIIPVG